MKIIANEDKSPLEQVESVKSIPKEELEFKAAAHHEIWMERVARQGVHNKLFHINAFTVAPPLRHDQRYCENCSFNMVPYKDLPEAVKELDRDIVRGHIVVQGLWERRKRS